MAEPASLQPTRDPRVTLPDLVEVLLNKGVYLNLDLIITVADIPLIGVNLRATLAGMETMLEYGMMRQWDEKTRASVRRSIARQVPLLPDEDVVARMPGGVYADDFHHSWRPGTVYLTDRRLFVFRREPAELLWQAPWEHIRTAGLHSERAVGGEQRQRLRVELVDGTYHLLSTADPERLLNLVRRHLRGVGGPPGAGAIAASAAPLRESHAWYQERRAGSAVWRGGTARLDRRTGLTWRSPLDGRPAVNLTPRDITGVELRPARTPAGDSVVMAVATRDDTVLLAPDDATEWAALIRETVPEGAPRHELTEVQVGAHR
ncbi:Gas vesicle protein [Micromonospora pattaloongensis]|uniref:Gas vesicle protein n=1 Tax=Micromonospora pattaloongensis TaxID=405436 RepID=A0A1H3LY82_9ACTN|nr:gas vesicle protein [Micromonospora pattaloongensis]SDY69392.1 Gas vesicle protein [Micromonospora pattaloongensis]